MEQIRTGNCHCTKMANGSIYILILKEHIMTSISLTSGTDSIQLQTTAIYPWPGYKHSILRPFLETQPSQHSASNNIGRIFPTGLLIQPRFGTKSPSSPCFDKQKQNLNHNTIVAEFWHTLWRQYFAWRNMSLTATTSDTMAIEGTKNLKQTSNYSQLHQMAKF